MFQLVYALFLLYFYSHRSYTFYPQRKEPGNNVVLLAYIITYLVFTSNLKDLLNFRKEPCYLADKGKTNQAAVSLKKFVLSFCVGSDVPRLVHQENIHSNVILLRKEYAWLIGGALPQEELHEWKLLYHSTVHGLSFNTFLGNVS